MFIRVHLWLKSLVRFVVQKIPAGAGKAGKQVQARTMDYPNKPGINEKVKFVAFAACVAF